MLKKLIPAIFTSLLMMQSSINAQSSCNCNWSTDGLYFKGSFIYWCPAFQGFSVAALNKKIAPTGDRESIHIKNLNFPYAPGFKLGAGYEFPNEDWDIFLNWTWLRSNPQSTVSSKDGFLVQNLGQNNPRIFADKAITRGHLQLNVCDFDLGKTFYFTNCGDVRLFAGFKSTWLNYSFKTDFSNPIAEGPSIVMDVRNQYRDNIPGVGPRIGFNSRWYLGSPHFAFVVNGAGTLLWENFSPRLAGLFIGDNAPHGGIVKTHVHGLNPVTELFVGLSYMRCFNGIDATILIGYEMQYWAEQNHGSFVAGTMSQSFNMQGLTASLALSF